VRTGTPAPTAAPTSAATATPVANANSNVYDPSVGVVPYFPTSPYSQKIPNPPTVNANNAAYVSGLGSFTLNTLNAFTAAAVDDNHGEPIYMNHAGSNTPVKIHCTENYGNQPCNVEGDTIYIDPREIPQNGDVSGQDDHIVFMDPAAGYEYDFWVVHQWPPQNGVLTVNWGGRCALSGSGFTTPSCASTAIGTPVSMGLIRAKDLVAAVSSGGALPQAIAVAVNCPGAGVGDGQCPGNAPEGSRMYLAMHDSDVNALNAAPITKVILRTLDEDHYGAIIMDTGGSQSGIQMQAESDDTYTVWGLPGPWMTQFIPLAQSEGLPGSSGTQNDYQVQLPIPSSVASALRFL
jgi:hypothetical protein